MAGYSRTPLAKKLGIKEGHRVAFPGAPAGFGALVGDLPDGARVRARAAGPLDVIVFFAADRAQLERGFDALKNALAPAGGFWVAWPKRSSGVPTDLTEDVIRNLALERGLVDNKVCAIDDTWSGLRLVYRLADRA